MVSGRIEALKRKFTIARASREAASNAAGQAHVGPHPVMQCPEDSFWKEWQNPPKRPEA